MYLVRTDSLKINDKIMVYNNNNKYNIVNILDITYSMDKAVAPITIDGNIIINNVLISSHVINTKFAKYCQLLSLPFHFISNYIDTNLASFLGTYAYEYIARPVYWNIISKLINFDTLSECVKNAIRND